MPRLLLFLALLTSLIPAAAPAQSVTPIPKLDLTQITGTWYEVARYPNKREKRCTAGALVLYSLADKPGRLQIVTTCPVKNGATDIQNQDARTVQKIKVRNQSTDGRLETISLYFLHSKFYVLALAADNSWAAIGAPNHKTLSILSRTRTLPQQTLATIEQQLTTQGFQQSKINQVAQPTR